ncbi:MAG: class I SAM-dependent methyltransferase [Syntrophobacteraceae bacterium]|nr:class I SAM-dependent methyltransferase [Syntrophobacteraceae bacterium]
MGSQADRIKGYQSAYLGDYGFEKTMVWARQKYLVSLIKNTMPELVLEIGCGYDQLFEKVSDIPSIRKWTIIEPSDIFFAAGREKMAGDPRVEILQGYAEEIIGRTFPDKVELCICSSLLHEVEQPERILHAARQCLCEGGALHVNVPNAKSFHRLLACEMRLISSPYQLSARNQDLMQRRVFDIETLRSLVENNGFVVVNSGGYFLKPFTHGQMEKLVEQVGGNILEGLWRMGVNFPDMAGEIFVNGIRK